jgi:hypothetical protein
MFLVGPHRKFFQRWGGLLGTHENHMSKVVLNRFCFVMRKQFSGIRLEIGLIPISYLALLMRHLDLGPDSSV